MQPMNPINTFSIAETCYGTWRIYCHVDMDLVPMRVLKSLSMWNGSDWREKNMISFEFSNADIFYAWEILEMMNFIYLEPTEHFSLVNG